MSDQTYNNQRSIIDEIREEIQLDNYYRRLENRLNDLDDEYYDDQMIDFEYEFEFAE